MSRVIASIFTERNIHSKQIQVYYCTKGKVRPEFFNDRKGVTGVTVKCHVCQKSVDRLREHKRVLHFGSGKSVTQ